MILLLKVFRQSASTVNSKLPTDSFQGMFEQMFLSKWNCWLHIKLFICFKIHVIMGFLVRCCLNCFNWMPINFVQFVLFFSQRGGGSGPLIYLIVLDTCMDDEDFQAVKVWFINTAVALSCYECVQWRSKILFLPPKHTCTCVRVKLFFFLTTV